MTKVSTVTTAITMSAGSRQASSQRQRSRKLIELNMPTGRSPAQSSARGTRGSMTATLARPIASLSGLAASSSTSPYMSAVKVSTLSNRT